MSRTMSRTLPRILAMGVTAALAAPGLATEYDDPEWPCIQRKVERLSPGLMWPAPLDDAPADPAARALGATLTLRRLTEEELAAEIARYAAAHPSDLAAMSRVFRTVFDSMAARRTRIIEGIAAYSLGQIDRAARIDAARDEMEAEAAKDAPDFDRLDALEEQIAWDERIYTDRRQSLTYVCETPQLLEKRLYAIARMLQQAATD